VLGAIGFGLGLALAGAIYGAVTFRVNDFNLNVLLGSLLFALAGAIGGALLGVTRAVRASIGLFTLAGAVALGLGYFLTVNLYSTYLSDALTTNSASIIAYVLQFALIGALAGAFMGAVQRDGRQALTLAVAGAFGFGIGFFLQDALGSRLEEPFSSLVPGTLGDPTHDSLTLAIVFGLTFLVAGLIGGAGLGLGLGQEPANMS
jgi:predicted neutral ceramidase superfamily lipid hydrolase